jgi:hypothetical protein
VIFQTIKGPVWWFLTWIILIWNANAIHLQLCALRFITRHHEITYRTWPGGWSEIRSKGRGFTQGNTWYIIKKRISMCWLLIRPSISCLSVPKVSGFWVRLWFGGVVYKRRWTYGWDGRVARKQW